MTISKFLISAAVCAVSIGGVSTSYGAEHDNTFEQTPLRVDGRESASNSLYASAERLRPDDDNGSDAGSIGSTTSTLNMNPKLIQEMDSLLEQLARVPRTVTFPGHTEGATPAGVFKTKVHTIKYALGNLVEAYTALAAEKTTRTAELETMAAEIHRLTAELVELKSNTAAKDVEIKELRAANSAHVELNMDTTSEKTKAADGVKPRNVEFSKWTYVAGAVAAGAGAGVLGKIIFDSWPSIVAKVFGR